MPDIAVIGYPSRYGGADTELDHQIEIWQALGWTVHIIHTGIVCDNLRSMRLEDRGCVVHSSRDWTQVKGKVVISYCNGEFLKALEEIRQHEPKSVLWVNCMSFLFDDEKIAHGNGLIDWFIYQRQEVMEDAAKTLSEINGNLNQALVNPFFNSDRFPFAKERDDSRFRICRISREDTSKFHSAQLWVYETMVSPVLKEVTMLGVNDAVQLKLLGPGKKDLPNWIHGLAAGTRPVEELYAESHCLIHMADPSLIENLPRVAFEAMASGCVLCVDDRGGWRKQIQHGQTGFLCADQKEFVYYGSRLAFERDERRLMAENARDLLKSEWGLEAAKKNWSEFFDRALGEW